MPSVRTPIDTGYNPLTAFPWEAAFWADDPSMTQPSQGATITYWPYWSNGQCAGRVTNGTGAAYWATQSRLNNRGAFTGQLSTGNNAVNIPLGRYSLVFVGINTSSNLIPFGAGANAALPWCSVGPAGGVTGHIATSRGNGTYGYPLYAWFIYFQSSQNRLSSASVDNYAHLLRFSCGAGNFYIDEKLQATGCPVGVAASGLAIGMFDVGTNGSSAGAIGFIGLYRHTGALDITSEPNWPAFKNWAYDYYGIRRRGNDLSVINP